MKKHKLGLNKLALSKSRIAELNRENVKGGWNTASTNPFCFATGYYDDGCNVTENCNTANHCGGTNNCPSAACPPPTQTLQLISCYEDC
ncbi:hypothetical protein [uncultured Kordia sp.]|uniref:hypothetical protein n=1 Tax=uncultured Kordia sp. TaxID=507699 RepID=UPI0026298E74|nr:hypothetical protein [uncultured Kordia sp.]